MNVTDRAMAGEEWARIEALGDRVTIDDALLGTLRDRIRELEAALRRVVSVRSSSSFAEINRAIGRADAVLRGATDENQPTTED